MACAHLRVAINIIPSLVSFGASADSTSIELDIAGALAGNQLAIRQRRHPAASTSTGDAASI